MEAPAKLRFDGASLESTGGCPALLFFVMFAFKGWVDRWVEEYGDSSEGRGHAASVGEFPDDSRRRRPIALQCAAESDGTRRSFLHFWFWHRGRKEIGGGSLASVYALLGANERSFRGHLVIRNDLDAAEYLGFPSVRRAWRLLNVLAEAKEGDTRARSIDHILPAAILRRLEIDPAKIAITARRLLERLVRTGFLDARRPLMLTERARELVHGGSVGSFYRAFLIRSINRAAWGVHDGFAEASLVQIHALFLLFLIHRSKEGLSALELVDRLAGIACLLKIERSPEYLPSERSTAGAIVLGRFLRGFGSYFGLLRTSAEIEVSEPLGCPYRETAFATRVFHWQSIE